MITQTRYHIRWFIRTDLPEILEIEKTNTEHHLFEDDILTMTRQRNCICLVAEQGEIVVGFVIYEIHKSKLHVLRLGVDVRCKRCGVGTELMDKLKSKLRYERTHITIDVRETDLGMQLFLRKQGFKCIKVLREFYKDSGEDGYWFEYHITESRNDFANSQEDL